MTASEQAVRMIEHRRNIYGTQHGGNVVVLGVAYRSSNPAAPKRLLAPAIHIRGERLTPESEVMLGTAAWDFSFSGDVDLTQPMTLDYNDAIAQRGLRFDGLNEWFDLSDTAQAEQLIDRLTTID